MKLIGFLALGIIAMLVLAGGIAALDLYFGGKYYEGKVTLTEQEYKAFKIAVGNKQVKIENISVLSSTEPIVVGFNLRVKGDFLYGEEKSQLPWILLAGVVAGSFVGGICYGIYREGK